MDALESNTNFGLFSYLSAMYFANESLKHLSYPMQILGKSCKLIPVVMLEYIARGRKYGVRETVYVILITVGTPLLKHVITTSHNTE